MSYVISEPVRALLDDRRGMIVKLSIEFTTDGAGDAGTELVEFGGDLVGIETTDTADVAMTTVDNVDILGTSGTALFGRITPTEPIAIVGGVNLTITGGTASTTAKIILYVR